VPTGARSSVFHLEIWAHFHFLNLVKNIVTSKRRYYLEQDDNYRLFLIDMSRAAAPPRAK
jgi:hypothetical protein